MSSDEQRIKSAFEIAMERVEKLGDLSTEEKQRLRQEELASAGEALAERYLSGLPLRDIDTELAKRNDDDRRVVTRQLVSHLLDKVHFDDPAADDTTLAALEHLAADSGIAQNVKEILQQHGAALEKARQESVHTLGKAKLQELERRGISGSAIDPAAETSAAWLSIKDELDSRCRAQLEEARGRFLNS
jgi:hypothetical protein